MPSRDTIEAMAAKTDTLLVFGKPVSEMDPTELRAAIWGWMVPTLRAAGVP